MVFDARFANLCHRRPPGTVLGSGSAIASLDLREYALELVGFGGLAQLQSSRADADVQDALYQYDVHELGSWFVLEKVRAGDFNIESCWCDSLERYVPVPPEAQVFIAIDAMCMGWLWAAFFCQAGVVHLASKAF